MRVFLAGCAIGLAVACSASAAPPVVSHSELVARAGRICDRYARALQDPTGAGGTLGQPAYDDAWLRLFGRQRAELAALRPGRRDYARYRRFLASLPKLEEAARGLMAVLERGGTEQRARAPLSRFLSALGDSTDRARAVGLRRCPAA